MAAAEFVFPIKARRIVESKSFKLYLNSFNQTIFRDRQEVVQTLESDLSVAAQGPVMVRLMSMSQLHGAGMMHMPGVCIDDQQISIDTYEYNPELLELDLKRGRGRETLHSHLLKSNCPVTGQPDWGTIMIDYSGVRINHASCSGI